MEIRKALPEDLPVVGEITRCTVQEVYPSYYPAGAVDFFLDWHRDEAILPDIQAGEVYLLWAGSEAVGTVTLHKDEITRLYVPRARQGRGYGRALLDFAEKAIGEKYGRIRLEASRAVLEAGIPGSGYAHRKAAQRGRALLGRDGKGLGQTTYQGGILN